MFCHCLSLVFLLFFLLFFSSWISFFLKADQNLFICLCVLLQHRCADSFFMSAGAHACFSVTAGFNHLWSEAAGRSQRWPAHAHPVSACARVPVYTRSFALLVLQSCSTANDPAKHLNDKKHTLPAVLWATANKLVSQTLKVVRP